ncbi:MAG: hypothetical protein EBR82_46585 [Caulobacteraceae bacterium]|nr:hypothetical protein [Caulobacteraceae bacterium]
MVNSSVSKDTKVEDYKVQLPENESVSKKTTLGRKIYIFLDPKTREVVDILADGAFGISYYNKEKDQWVLAPGSYSWRVHDLFNDYVNYVVDWKNDEAFDENNKSLALVKYVDGTLNEEWLEEYTLFGSNPARE